MKRLLVGLLSFQLAFITSPDAVIRFDFSLDRAEARGNGRAGGFHGAAEAQKPALREPVQARPDLARQYSDRPANRRSSSPTGPRHDLPPNLPHGPELRPAATLRAP